MPTSAEPVHKGTLVCVVLKARNLPNKKSIGKQDPYTVLTMGHESQKTKPDKRGGQHPSWDEQLHFEVYEDMEDALVKDAANGSGSASKATSASALKTKGGKKVLKVACYADDSKEPEFIGEGIVDLTDTLKTGEYDEWVTIKAKDRYAGEVYLELTFYSAAAPPKKRRPSTQPAVLSATDSYGGAGSFSRIEDGGNAASTGSGSGAPPKPPKGKGDHPPIPASMRPGSFSAASSNSHHRMSSSISASGLASMHRPPSAMSHSQTMHDLGSSTLRPSSSLATMDTYTPAYAPASISRGTSPAPPSSAHHLAAHNHASSMGPTAGGSRRNSFNAPMPSEFGHSIQPSGSYYSQHSITPSQSSQYIAHHPQPGDPSDDMYATVKPADFLQQQQHQQHQRQQQYSVPRSHSISHIPVAYNQMPQPDFGADQLAQSMSKMGFGHSAATMDRPPPPRSPVHAEERPPQSHIYQAPAHLASLYTPPPTAGYPQDVQRPVSPAARPASALSQYSSHSAHHTSTPSVVNAQAYYQQPQAGGHLAQPTSIPPRTSSPGASSGYHPIPSPYSQPAQPSHVSRPLPSTQSSSSISSHAPPQPQQQQHVYPSHLYQPVQQPSPPPHQQQLPHSTSQSFSHNTWHGAPPTQASQPAQPTYAPAPAPHHNGSIPPSASSGYLYTAPPQPSSASSDQGSWGPGRSPSPLPPIPGHQQPSHLPSSGSMHGFYGTSPAAAPASHYAHPPQTYSQQYAPPAQQYEAPPPAGGRRQSIDPSGYPYPRPPPPQQQHYATVSAGSQYQHGGLPSSFSSSALYQSHQNSQYHHQQYQ
ncbi:C2 domain protein [Kalmanozyma brasiliensis GHG001]|uniref:C2 domain protein n=1 Tax=Kalmanozyma brasiliensis (strain GHG001) TaxID=1365824 RepID=UPI002867D91B|nr:C2 domain protein [Kalmanozyma brasiliensis GHG001]EST06981.2 C2 domain protein [Kalmanozyma brasiliensis GHG001]